MTDAENNADPLFPTSALIRNLSFPFRRSHGVLDRKVSWLASYDRCFGAWFCRQAGSARGFLPFISIIDGGRR